MGKRLVACLLLVALLVPALALAAPGDKGFFQQLEHEVIYADTRRFIEELLDMVDARDILTGKEIRVGDWYVHPEGFAFRIPNGYELVGRYKSANIMLVDETGENVPHRTTISIAIAGRDEGLTALTREKVKSIYASQFNRFDLRSFDREEMCGEECIRLTFTYNDNPQLLVQHCMFNKGGHSYIIMMMVENNVQAVEKALRQFNSFTGSLIFGTRLSTTNKK